METTMIYQNEDSQIQLSDDGDPWDNNNNLLKIRSKRKKHQFKPGGPIVAQLKLILENKITSSFGRMNLVSN